MTSPTTRITPSSQPSALPNGAVSAGARGSTLVIAAHPALRQSHVNARFMRAAAAAGPQVEVVDLYACYPDYLIDIATEQRRLAAAQLVVWQHPVHWYAMPALMKLWVDEVLTFGWAYGPGGTALRGKDLWLVLSTGGPESSYHPASYNRYFFDAFLPPSEQTAALCGMRFLPPLLLHDARHARPEDVDAQAATYTRQLATYPDWPELQDLEAAVACDVPTAARPPVEAAPSPVLYAPATK